MGAPDEQGRHRQNVPAVRGSSNAQAMPLRRLCQRAQGEGQPEGDERRDAAGEEHGDDAEVIEIEFADRGREGEAQWHGRGKGRDKIDEARLRQPALDIDHGGRQKEADADAPKQARHNGHPVDLAGHGHASDAEHSEDRGDAQSAARPETRSHQAREEGSRHNRKGNHRQQDADALQPVARARQRHRNEGGMGDGDREQQACRRHNPEFTPTDGIDEAGSTRAGIGACRIVLKRLLKHAAFQSGSKLTGNPFSQGQRQITRERRIGLRPSSPSRRLRSAASRRARSLVPSVPSIAHGRRRDRRDHFRRT